MKIVRRRLFVFCVLMLTAVMLFCSIPAVSAIDGCDHSYEIDPYSGLSACSICKELCAHENWNSSKCKDCRAVCMHDWSYTSSTSTCRICGKTCSNHSKIGLDFDCAYCGKELNLTNSYNSGDMRVYDGNIIVDDVHSVSFNFDFTVGTKSTVLNKKDTSKSDNIYHNTTDAASNKSDYYSFFTHIASGNNFRPLASLWLDTAETKLYLVKANSSATKICEIKPGYEYNFDIVFELKTGKYMINVCSDGEKVGSLSSNITGLSTLTSSDFRFGEGYNAKYLHIQKISFENIEFDYGFSNGVCRLCGAECGHSYNIGGHCDFCGVKGNPITFNDGKNGGGNIVHTANNPKPLTVKTGYYSNTSYSQGWDFRDIEGILLGRDYVLNAKYTFNEAVDNSTSTSGNTALIIFSDADVKSDFWKFALYLYTNNGYLELGTGSGSRVKLELGKEYDIRIAVRSTETETVGTYLQRAEISINGALTWVKEFTLTAADGISIRLGDHVTRKSKVKYDIKNDFSISFLDDEIKYIGVQEKENADYSADDTFALRFVFGLDDIYLEDAGIKAKVSRTGGSDGDVGGEKNISASKTVLTEVLESGKVRKPGVRGAGYGGYYLALSINEIELDTAATYTFELTPYVKNHQIDGVVYMPDTYTIKVSFSGGKAVIDYSDTTAIPKVSANGLDSVVGLHKNDFIKLKTTADTYVEAGASKTKNFGSNTVLDFKALNGTPNEYYRVALLKFNLSDLTDDEFSNACLVLNCEVMENTTTPTTVHVYSCPTSWTESGVTYNSLPKKGTLVATGVVKAIGIIKIDISDYIKDCVKNGTKEIAFFLEGDADSIRRLKFSSKESGNIAPSIDVRYGNYEYSTYVEYTAENPWQTAMDSVKEWLVKWPTIKANGSTDVETIEKIDAEYSLTVDAANASKTNGDNTVYTKYPTRVVSTLQGYEASTAELDLYDEYGGYKDENLKQAATGYFYTKKIGDRWWTIDPLGYPYYRTACVQIAMGTTKQKAALLGKYGTVSGWAHGATDRMWELGFNSAGGWSDTDNLIKVDAPLSQTSILYVMKKYASSLNLDVSSSGSTDFVGSVIPAFDPAFERYADMVVKNGVSGYVNSPYIYGWMSDNELPSSKNMLDSSLLLDPTDERFIYSYATAWTFMYLKTGKANVSVNDVTDALRIEYRAMVYDKYFDIVSSKLEKYDPNHMFIGCRFINNCYKDESIMRVAGYYCDAVTFNYYSVWEPDAAFIANVQKWINAPFIITEWYAKGMDACTPESGLTNKSGAGWTVRTQADRGKFYQNYVLQLLECKGCVGFDWFKYLDNDPDSTTADASNTNSNKGIIDNNSNEYTALTAYMEELNNQKYNLIKFFDAR